MDTSIKRLLEVAGVSKAKRLVETVDRSLANKIAEVLLNQINKWEESGMDPDNVETAIDDWFDSLKAQIRKKL